MDQAKQNQRVFANAGAVGLESRFVFPKTGNARGRQSELQGNGGKKLHQSSDVRMPSARKKTEVESDLGFCFLLSSTP